jgi:PGF-CTERM protein/uncharacterized repeat protein (TIGR01451 family)
MGEVEAKKGRVTRHDLRHDEEKGKGDKNVKRNRNRLKDFLLNRRGVVSILIAFCLLASLSGSAMASSDEVLILHFDEGSGTIARDSSGSGNDGTIYGATWVDGKYGKALSFDGVDDYVQVPDSDSLDITGAITIEAWIFLREFKSPYSMIISKGAYGTDKGAEYEITVDPSGYYEVYRLKNDNYGAEYDIYQFSPNTWYHFAITFNKNEGEVKTYVNGILQRKWSKSNNIYDSVRPLLFGVQEHKVGSKGYYFHGIIDEIYVYNRALSAEEIKTLYDGKKPALTLTKSASPSTIQEGETTTISIRVENTGSGDAKAVAVTDTIPMGFKIISGSKSESFGEIKSGDYRTLRYTLKATGSGKFTCDPATATYTDADGNSYSAASNSMSIQVGGEVPVGADSDGDGWSDEKEKEMGTNLYSVDSDGDGLKDPEDPNPTVPEEKKTPGFEVVFAIAGLLAVAYLWRRRG